MKKRGILFSILSMMCLGLVAGCGEDEYVITAVAENGEYGYVTGGGEYVMGAEVNLKMYSTPSCTPTRIEFRQPAAGEGEEEYVAYIENSQFSEVENSHYEYKFKVTANSEEARGTIGTYKVLYTCEEKRPQSSSTAQRTVTYKVDLNADGDYADEGETFTKSVSDGSTTENVGYINNKKITWKYHDDHGEDVVYDFTKLVTKDITLTGVISGDWNNLEIVKDALNNFKSNANLSITATIGEEKKKAIIVGLDKYTNDYSTNGMKFYVQQYVNNAFRTRVAMVKSGADNNTYYYEDLIDNPKRILLNGSEYTVEDLKEAYLDLFLPLNDLDLTNHILDDITVNEGVYTFSTKEANPITIALKIENGAITSYEYNEDSKNVKCDVTYSAADQIVDTTAPQAFMVKLSSDNTDLNELLESNNDIDEVLKVIPSREENVETAIANHAKIREVLKGYTYSFTRLQKVEGSDEIQEVPFSPGTTLTSHLSLKVIVNGDVSDITTAFNGLAGGNYTIDTVVTTDIGPATNSYTVESGVDITKLTEKPSEMNELVWVLLQEVKKLSENKYYKSEYKNGEWNIYLTEGSVNPELKVKLVNEKISTVKYLSENEHGDIITYVSTFTDLPAGNE